MAAAIRRGTTTLPTETNGLTHRCPPRRRPILAPRPRYVTRCSTGAFAGGTRPAPGSGGGLTRIYEPGRSIRRATIQERREYAETGTGSADLCSCNLWVALRAPAEREATAQDPDTDEVEPRRPNRVL